MMSDESGLASRLRELEKKSSIEEVYESSVARKRLYILGCAVVTVVLLIAALSLGSVDIPFSDTVKVILRSIFPFIDGPENETYSLIVLQSRLPKALMAIITGAALGVAGAVMQGILRNPLVSPFTLGVSSAAAFGAVIGIIFWPMLFGAATSYIYIFGNIFYSRNLLVMLFAFLVGLASVMFVLFLARRSDVSKSTVILAGVIIGYLFQAGVSFGKYLSDDEALSEITFWLLGSLNGVTISTVLIVLPPVILCMLYMEYLAPKINVMAAGDDVAKSLGVNVPKIRNHGLIVATLITCVCIAFTGVIGFIGLMAPHISRMIIGNDTRYLLPAAAVTGSVVLLVSDILSRTLFAPEVLPIGIFMYLFGGIFFIWLIGRKKRDVVM